MKRFLGYALLFIAIFSMAVFFLNVDTLAPGSSEARPLVIAGDTSGGI